MKKGKAAFASLPGWARIGLLAILILAVLFGILFGVLKAVKSSSGGVVNVYSIGDLTLYEDANQVETSGMVRTDKLQSVYISSTQTVTEMFVKEGDTVKAGDKILSFDTTLSDLELERQRIKVQQLELDIRQAQDELYTISTYRVYDPDAAEETPAPGPALISVPYLPYLRTGDGTEETPYRYLWDDTCVYNADFVNNTLGLPAVPEDYEPGTGTLPAVAAVFEVRDANSLEGDILRSWELIFTRTEDGGYSFVLTEPAPEQTEPAEEPAAEEEEADDYTPSYTWQDILSMKLEAQKKITELEMQLKTEQLRLDTMTFELSDGVVVAKIDGEVKSVLDRETALGENKPLVLISGGGGYYITGYIGELDRETVHVGDTVTVMSWENYMETEATILEISPYPTSNYSGWSNGNNNVSYYPFTVFLPEDADLRENEYVSIRYTPGGDSHGLYIENPFLRTENGRSYLMVQGEDGRLEKRYVTTGGSYWGSYTEVFGDVDADSWLAFPYGKDVKEGAKTEQKGIDALYNY